MSNLSQSKFLLPKIAKTNKSTIFFCLNKLKRCGEKIQRKIAGFDMSYEEFKDLCGEAWEDEEFQFFYLDRG